MLERVDRMQLAVRDRAQAAATYARLLGAEVAREADSAYLNARRTILALGESELELCQPLGPGPAQAFVDRWGEGLLAAGFASSRPDELARHLDATGVRYARDGDQLCLPASSTAGMPMVISPLAARRRVGPVSFLYEATNALAGDWRRAAELYTRLFRLDPDRFSPIGSERFGYEGTLLLFDPPARLDRIELAQTFVHHPGAMRRFVERRGGDALYMCFLETHDFDGLKKRLLEGGAHVIPRGSDLAAEHDGAWVHPRSLHGLLLGISRESLGWLWSGRPNLVRPL